MLGGSRHAQQTEGTEGPEGPGRGEEPTALHVVEPGADAHPPGELRPTAEPGGRRWGRGPLAALLVVALGLGAGGMALGVAALLRTPAAGARGPIGRTGARGARGPTGAEGAQGIQGPAGPQGRTGPAGPEGKEGPAGPAGPRGATGKQGPAGTIAASSIVAKPVMKTAIDPSVGTVLTAVSSCPAGAVLLGGGGQVATTNPSSSAKSGGAAGTSSASTGSDGATRAGTASSASAGTSTTAANADVALKSSYPVTGGWETVAVVTSPLPAGQVMTLEPYVVCGKK